uniref:Phospholipase A1 member A n=1 Tax=Cacopsylla melanoneura TaxID=428564 RepID=A0A8D8SCB5_9HEMI
MTIVNAVNVCFQLMNLRYLRLTLAVFICLICTHQGSSTVVPIGSCVLIYSELCPRSEIQFFLFTRNNPNNSELVYFSDVFDNVTSSSFNSSLPNKIIIHGYNADMNLDILQNIKTAYLQKGDYNVWFVNWPDLCRGPCYPVCVYNLDQVGKCVAQMIARLRKVVGNTEPDVHLIGFSLGAHVAAYTSKYLRPYKLPRITGLDPAMPLFSSRDRDHRLDIQDAKFVDVIHTSAFVQGQFARSGHVDFYMNGGIEQPGCWNSSNMFDCNHRRAAKYFAETINSAEGFWGWPCTGIFQYLLDMCPMKQPIKLMGEMCEESSRGFYIVPTKASTPFAKGPLKIPDKSKINSASKANAASSRENAITKSSAQDKKNKPVKTNLTRTGKAKKLDTTDTPKKTSSTSSSTENEIRSTSSQETSSSEASTTSNEITTEQTETTTVTDSLVTETETESTDSVFEIDETEINFSEPDSKIEKNDSKTQQRDTTATEKTKDRFIQQSCDQPPSIQYSYNQLASIQQSCDQPASIQHSCDQLNLTDRHSI